MANILVDRLFVEYVGKLNRASMGQVQGGFSQLGRSVNKTSRTMASGFQQSTILARRTAREVGLLVPLFATLGRVFYKTGSEVEFAFTKLRTQLGLTADETERAKKEMKGLAGETGRQWEELGRGYFSLRSAGVSESASMDTMAAAAKGAAIGLGDVQNIALLAAGALNSYGESNITATRAVEALLSTVKLGNIKDATVLAQQMPQLLPHGARLGVDFEELGAAMAAYTRTGADAARVATAIKRALSKTFTPTRQGIKLLEEFGLSTAMVRHDVKTKGWFRWLKEFTQVTLNSDPDLIRRYFQDQRALGFINDFIGKSDQYMWILERQYKAAGSIAEAMTVVDETGFHAVAQVWAKIKTTFANIYFVAVKPFLMAFNKLPSAIQQATLAMIAFGTATALAGRLMGFRGVGVWAGEMFRVGRILKNVAGTGMWGGGRRTEFHRDLIGQGGGLGAMVSLGMRKGRITKRWADHRRKSGAKAWAKKGGLSGWIGGSLFGTEASRSILNKAKDSKLAEKMKSIRAKALAQDHRDRAVEKRYHSTRANVKSARSNLTQADKGIAAMQARQAVLQSTTPRSKKKKRAHRRKVAKHKKLLTTAQQKRGVLTTQLTSAMAAADVARANRKGMAHEKYIAEKTERHDKKREKRNAKRERRRARYGKMGKIGGVLKGGAGRVGGFLGKIPGLGLLAGPLAALMTMMSPLVGMFASVAGSLLAMVVAVGAPILIIGGLLALLLIKSKSFRQLSVHTFGLIWDTLKFIYYWFKGRFRDLGRWMKRIFSDTPLGRWFGKATQWAGDLMADIAGWVIGIRKLLGLATEKEKLEQDKEAIAMLEAQGVDSSLRNQLLALEYTADEIIAFGKSLASADLDSILRGKNVGEAGVGNIMKNLRALLPPDDTGQPLTAADLESLLRDKDTEEDKVADVMKLFQTLGYDGGQPLTAADLESLLRDKDVGEDHWQRADLLIADIMKDIQELGHDPTQPLPAADLESILRRRQVEDDKVTDIMRTFRALGYDIIVSRLLRSGFGIPVETCEF